MAVTVAADVRHALIVQPTDTASELAHSLLSQGLTVHVAGDHPDARLVDLAQRNLITLVRTSELSDALQRADLVVNDSRTRLPSHHPLRSHDPLASHDPLTSHDQRGHLPPAASASGATSVGTVTLVGGGPGDAGLITVAGREAVLAADVVVCDRLAPLALLSELGEHVEVIHVGKIPRGPFTEQDVINRVLIDRAGAGHEVARLKGGDSFVFGRGGEEWNACVQAGIPVRVVPGISSAIAVPALVGIPVTHRTMAQGFLVVSGHVPPGDPRSSLDWPALARVDVTLIVLMGVATLGAIADALIAGGKPAHTPAASIADGATPSQRIVRAHLGDIARASQAGGISPPAVTVIGPVAAALPAPTGAGVRMERVRMRRHEFDRRG